MNLHTRAHTYIHNVLVHTNNTQTRTATPLCPMYTSKNLHASCYVIPSTQHRTCQGFSSLFCTLKEAEERSTFTFIGVCIHLVISPVTVLLSPVTVNCQLSPVTVHVLLSQLHSISCSCYIHNYCICMYRPHTCIHLIISPDRDTSVQGSEESRRTKLRQGLHLCAVTCSSCTPVIASLFSLEMSGRMGNEEDL